MNELIILDIELRAIQSHIIHIKTEYALIDNTLDIYTEEETLEMSKLNATLHKLREIEKKILDKIVAETIKKYEQS